jgi:hypothetical protein
MEILHEAGEAIGNIGRRVFRRKRARVAQETLERWLERVPLPQLQPQQGGRTPPEEDAIDVSYRVIDPDQEQQQKEHRDG